MALYFIDPTPNPNLVEAFVNLVFLLPRSLIQGVLMLLDRLTLRATQRAEYLADSMAARTGSTEAAAAIMNHFLVVSSAATMLQREANRPAGRPTRHDGPGSPGRGCGSVLAPM